MIRNNLTKEDVINHMVELAAYLCEHRDNYTINSMSITSLGYTLSFYIERTKDERGK